jgi:hypothetical protein
VPAVALYIACGLHNLSSPLADDFFSISGASGFLPDCWDNYKIGEGQSQ